MKGFFIRLFLRDNYPVAEPPKMQEQLNWAHAVNRWQRVQIRMLFLFVLFALAPFLEHLKTWLWQALFGAVK